MVKKVGLDFGNRYGKIKSNNTTEEIILTWREISEEEYNSATSKEGIERVKYNDKYYLIGETGTKGINSKNKGNKKERYYANMIKLVLLAKDMKNNRLTEQEYYVVTGTPYDDYEGYKQDYIDLILSPNGEFEIIEIDGKEYKIKVSGVYITKQSSSVSLTLPDRLEKNYLLWDFGGGTLDVVYYQKGTRIKGITKEFSINELFVELGKELRKYSTDFQRPDYNNAEFMKDMEILVSEGRYKKATTLEYQGKQIKLQEIVDEFIVEKLNYTIADILEQLHLKKMHLEDIINVHFGGGAKLLYPYIAKNEDLIHSKLAEKPEYRNVLAYYEIAQIVEDEDWVVLN